MSAPKSYGWVRFALILGWLFFVVVAFIDGGVDSQFDLVYMWLLFIAYLLLGIMEKQR